MLLGRKTQPQSRKPSLVKRGVRSVVAIAILTAFVLGISFFVKGISTVDSSKLTDITTPILTKVGLSDEAAGEVAGEFVSRFSETKITPKGGATSVEDTPDAAVAVLAEGGTAPLHKIAILADAHEDYEYLAKAIAVANDAKVDYAVVLGDHTDWGDIASLQEAKSALAKLTMPYFTLPGDHDLAEASGFTNFTQIFGQEFGTVTLGDTKMILFGNAPNFSPLTNNHMEWFAQTVQTADIVFLAQPIYHPTSTRTMGVVDGEIQPEVKAQADALLEQIRESDVKVVIASDHHRFSKNTDPVDSTLEHVAAGAITKSRNVQTPRITMLSLFEDGSYTVEEILL